MHILVYRTFSLIHYCLFSLLELGLRHWMWFLSSIKIISFELALRVTLDVYRQTCCILMEQSNMQLKWLSLKTVLSWSVHNKWVRSCNFWFLFLKNFPTLPNNSATVGSSALVGGWEAGEEKHTPKEFFCQTPSLLNINVFKDGHFNLP